MFDKYIKGGVFVVHAGKVYLLDYLCTHGLFALGKIDWWRLVYEEVIPESLSPHQVHQVPVAKSYLKLTGALL